MALALVCFGLGLIATILSCYSELLETWKLPAWRPSLGASVYVLSSALSYGFILFLLGLALLAFEQVIR